MTEETTCNQLASPLLIHSFSNNLRLIGKNTYNSLVQYQRQEMQKRRAAKGGSSADIPLTLMTDGATATPAGSITKSFSNGRAEKRSRNQRTNSSCDESCLFAFGLFFAFLIMFSVILFTDIDHISHHPEDNALSGAAVGEIYRKGSSMAQFSSLKYAFDNADIVGLYFAASWCSMSTPITMRIDELFSADTSPLKHRVLSPYAINVADEKKDFALVFVSSDDSEQDSMNYSKINWINIPFESKDRNDIKRHFRICAHLEMESLGIERRRDEIPSLVIIDSATHGVLSVSGKSDLLEYGEGVLDHWMSQKHLVRALEDKYDTGDEE